MPWLFVTKASKSPSPSTSAKFGVLPWPTSTPARGLSAVVTLAKVPLSLRKKVMWPSPCPMKASKSLSPSISAKVGALFPSTFTPSKGLPVPVTWVKVPLSLRKKLILPSLFPMKASLSPSPSISAKVGVLLPPTFTPLKGLSLPVTAVKVPLSLR